MSAYKPKLLFWLLSSAWLPNIIAPLIAVLAVLLVKKPLYTLWMEGVALIALHAAAVVVSTNWLGATRNQLPFLYTRGFGRNSLWLHHMLAAAVSAAYVLVPVAILLLTPARSTVQELLKNPAYPYVAGRDTLVLIPWVLAYAVAFAAFHYAWIRRYQPTSDRGAGLWLIAVAVIAFGWFGDFSWPVLHGGWHAGFGIALAVTFVTVVSIGSRNLHQNLELR